MPNISGWRKHLEVANADRGDEGIIAQWVSEERGDWVVVKYLPDGEAGDDPDWSSERLDPAEWPYKVEVWGDPDHDPYFTQTREEALAGAVRYIRNQDW